MSDLRTLHRTWETEEILEAVRVWTKEHGRTPRPTDWLHATDGHPSKLTVRRRFGGMVAAIRAAGLEPTETKILRHRDPEAEPVVLSARQAAQRLGVTPRTMARLIQEGQIAASRIPPRGNYRIELDELDRFIHASKHPPRSPTSPETPRARPRARDVERAVPTLALTPVEAAAALGVSREFFDEHVKPELRVVRRGRLVRVSVVELERWLEASSERTLSA